MLDRLVNDIQLVQHGEQRRLPLGESVRHFPQVFLVAARDGDDDYGLLSKKTKNTFEVKSTHATATSTPVCTGADVCASMEVMCEGGAKRKYGLYS